MGTILLVYNYGYLKTAGKTFCMGVKYLVFVSTQTLKTQKLTTIFHLFKLFV